LKLIIAGDIIADLFCVCQKEKNYATTLCIDVIFDDNRRRKNYLSLIKVFLIDDWFVFGYESNFIFVL
jgi:hypothetical protein